MSLLDCSLHDKATSIPQCMRNCLGAIRIGNAECV